MAPSAESLTARLDPHSARFARHAHTVVDDDGAEVLRGSGGYLVIDGTYPGMARTVWGKPERYRDSY
jgi:acyl-coenzyme A synthetase/AMP-(fatty) acid ligase